MLALSQMWCGEDVLVEEPAVEGQGAKHDGVHEHPSDQGRRGTLIEPTKPFLSDRLKEAVDRSFELAFIRGLEADFDGVEPEEDLAAAKASS